MTYEQKFNTSWSIVIWHAQTWFILNKDAFYKAQPHLVKQVLDGNHFFMEDFMGRNIETITIPLNHFKPVPQVFRNVYDTMGF